MVVLQSTENTSYEPCLHTKRKLWSRKVFFIVLNDYLPTFYCSSDWWAQEYYSVVYHEENKLKLESWVCTDKEAGRSGRAWIKNFHWCFPGSFIGMWTTILGWQLQKWLCDLKAPVPLKNNSIEMPTMWKGVSLCPSHYAKCQNKFTLSFLIQSFLNSV